MVMLRALVAGVLAMAMMIGGASAADFSGPYIGLMAGYGVEKLNPPAGGGTAFDWASSGATGGVFGGYGGVVQGVYLGIEGDVSLRDLTAKAGGGGGFAIESGGDWQGTIRARAGMPWGPALLYGTVGLAIMDSKTSVAGVGSDSNMLYGLVVGAGIEAQITKVMFIRLEARHVRMPDEDILIGGTGATIKHDGETTALIGLGFRF